MKFDLSEISMSEGEVVPDDECPNCRSTTDIEDGTRFCDYCGWDDALRCPHGIAEYEWCQQCPDGGV